MRRDTGPVLQSSEACCAAKRLPSLRAQELRYLGPCAQQLRIGSEPFEQPEPIEPRGAGDAVPHRKRGCADAEPCQFIVDVADIESSRDPHPQLDIGGLRDVRGKPADLLEATSSDHHGTRLPDPVGAEAGVEPLTEKLHASVDRLEITKTRLKSTVTADPLQLLLGRNAVKLQLPPREGQSCTR